MLRIVVESCEVVNCVCQEFGILLFEEYVEFFGEICEVVVEE